MGMPLTNPIGVAAGFDKDAQAIDGLFDLGFGYVEVGSVTPEPQPGNAQPRFFRLEEDDAAINRYGFNSLGHGQALGQLRKRLVEFSQEHPEHFPSPLPVNPLPPADLPRSLRPGHLLAVNLGKNKSSAADSNEDYIRGVRTLGPYADVVVINVSSPNTPGLRALQGRETLERLLSEVVAERDSIKIDGLPKLAVKVTCDLSDEELADVASAVRSSGVDGVIVSNTTVRRDGLGLKSEFAKETGGLSGKPLFPYALAALRTLRPLLPPSVSVIGAGGVWNGDDALAMAKAGASTVQVYTAFGYRGVGTPRLLKDEIIADLGNSTWRQNVGAEYDGKTLGWDESRVAAEAAAVRVEGAGLGQLLAEIKEKENLAGLKAEAEEALRHVTKGAGEARDQAEKIVATTGRELGDVAKAAAGEVKHAAEDVRAKAEGAKESAKASIGDALDRAGDVKDAAKARTEELVDAAKAKSEEIKDAAVAKTEEVKDAAATKAEQLKTAAKAKVEELRPRGMVQPTLLPERAHNAEVKAIPQAPLGSLPPQPKQFAEQVQSGSKRLV